jgi:preprotein translocase SecE subunit
VAKTRAQRKAEQRRRAALQQQGRDGDELAEESRAQHDTQVPESADVAEAELAERGVDLDQLKGRPDEAPAAPAPSRADAGAPAEAAEAAEPADKNSRRSRRQEEKERKQRAKDSEKRRAPKAAAPVERQRSGVFGFFASCWAELKRVQWPDRETLIQASAITLVFITVMAAYLGVLDAVFNWLVQRII